MEPTLRPLILSAVLALLCSGCAYRPLRPIMARQDKDRDQIGIRLRPVKVDGRPVRTGVPTEIRFLPTDTGKASRVLVVAEKRGTIRWVDLRTGESGFLLKIPNVGIDIEQGLLGFDFHPDFPAVPELYTHHQSAVGFGGRTVLTRWTVWGDEVSAMTTQGEQILAFDQPQGGHNGGQLSFGPDGNLYVGFGDGGWQGDPENQAQDPTTFFGSIIRIDVDRRDPGLAYAVPEDNPFVQGGHLPEVYAFGFRNPWRFDFGPEGVLLVADVGQDRLEEIDLVVAGGNYGWSLKEGTECYGLPRPGRIRTCQDDDLRGPIHEYRRSEGRAIIGGKFYSGSKVAALEGAFVFGDYTSGRLWALRPTEDGATVLALGGFGIAPTSFGRDDNGEVYVGVQSGRIYRLVPGS